MIQYIVAMVIVMATFLAQSVYADRSDRRQLRQSARIQHGIANGELTRQEARQLRAGQRHVRRVERRAEKDGNLLAQEKVRIEKAQDRQSRRIYRNKHDSDKAQE